MVSVRSRLVIFIILAASLVFGLLIGRQAWISRDLPRAEFAERKLRVLTYSTFVSASGPGGLIFKEFEKNNPGVKIEVTSAADAGLLLQRLKLTPADLVIGIDQLLLEEAQKDFQWQPLALDKTGWWEPAAELSSEQFVAFDWSPLTFVFRKDGKPVPQKFGDLLKSEFAKQFTVQDPRASTPGLQFFHWVKALEKENTEKWLNEFKPNVYNISPSWAFSYGLFKKQQTRFVFSYLTSLAFHWGDEKDRTYQVVQFAEGHPVQVELAGVPANCTACELGHKLLRTLHEDWAQKLIMTRNYMFPVRKGLEAGTIFGELPALKTIPTETGRDVREWDKVFPR